MTKNGCVNFQMLHVGVLARKVEALMADIKYILQEHRTLLQLMAYSCYIIGVLKSIRKQLNKCDGDVIHFLFNV